MNAPESIRCYIGIGSNLASPLAQVQNALKALAALPGSALSHCSSLYRSRPMGPSDQPDYINAVAELHTQLAPLTLLDGLQKIEQQHGRERKEERWGPRTLDLDLLLYGQQQIDLPRLQVPHYGMQQREFVLYPLQEIAPALILPCGTPLKALIEQTPRKGLQRLDTDAAPL